MKVAGDEARSREERGSEHGGVRVNIPTTLFRKTHMEVYAAHQGFVPETAETN